MFNKTLEFIKNSSIEELTKELSKYGINFVDQQIMIKVAD